MIVEFFTPWCKYCQYLSNDWSRLHTKYANRSDVIVGKMNCEDGDNYKICKQLEISSYPTILHFAPGDPVGAKFMGRERNFKYLS
jgi:thioredoxin-like negative regulator of GroEL